MQQRNLRLCYAEYEIIFYLWNILLPVLMLWPFSVIDGGSCSQLYQSGHKPSVDACQPLLLGSGYSMMFSMHCLQINVYKSARFRCSSVLWVSGINREQFLYFWFSSSRFLVEAKVLFSLPEYKIVWKNNFSLPNLLNESMFSPRSCNRRILLRPRIFLKGLIFPTPDW